MKNKMKTPYLIGTIRFILLMLLILGACIFYSFYGNPLKAENNSITVSDKSNAVDLANSVIDKTFKFVLNPNNSIQKKIDILKENLISKVDFSFVSAFVLGPVNRKMDDASKAKFKDLFSDLILYSYASKFSGYENYITEVIGTENLVDKSHVYVNFIIYKQGKKDSTKVDCKVRFRKNGNNLNIVDMVIAGISMSVTYRAEFKALFDEANNNGKDVVEVLINTLSNKIDAYKKGR